METMEKGKNYLISVPPSWLIGATYEERRGDYAVFKKAAYLETTKKGPSVFALCTAKNASDVIDRAYSIDSELLVRIDTITFFCETVCDFAEFSEGFKKIKGA